MPSTTEALLDVNVIIASVFQDHIHHEQAKQFVQDLEYFYTCPTTQGGFLRFATRPWQHQEIEQPPRLTMADAQAKLKEFAATVGHIFLPDDITFTDLPLRSMSGHRQWTDAYLLRLARRHSLRLASIESRMSNLDDATDPVLLLVL